MDTRSELDGTCVYCGAIADTNDHVPPQCLLDRPLPSNLLTLPACKRCNNQYSPHENLVRAIIGLVGVHEKLVAERQHDGRLFRALERDAKLRGQIDAARRDDGAIQLVGDVGLAFDTVFKKTARGLFWGLYGRLVPIEDLFLHMVSDQRFQTVDSVITEIRPSPLEDITDKPMSEISPNSWHTRQPVFFMKLAPAGGGAPQQRIFRLVRETAVDWICYQEGIFRVGFVKSKEGKAACVFDLWKSITVVVTAPWPDGRGPIRKGKKNPFSRERAPN
jgi:hypothetical protein